MEEDTYENLLNYFDSENNMNSGSSTVKEEIHNISLESRRVLTEIDNMLGESVNSEKDVADTEEKIELKIEIKEEQIEAKGDASETKEKSQSTGKRKAEEELKEEDGLPECSKPKIMKSEDDDTTIDSANNDNATNDDAFNNDTATNDDTSNRNDLEDEDDVSSRNDISEELLDEDEEDQFKLPFDKMAVKLEDNVYRDRLFELKQKYKTVLKRVYEIYSDLPDVGLNYPEATPVVHRDRENPNMIIGFESLQEFVDNQHPMWKFEREACYENMTSEEQDDRVISIYIHKRWGQQNINIGSSLSVLRDNSEEKENIGKVKPKKASNQENLVLGPQPDKVKTTIMEMDIDNMSQKVLERENNRRKVFLEKVIPLLKRDPQPANLRSYQNLVPCEDLMQMMKEKGQQENWTIERTAEAVAGVEEAASLTSHYTEGDTSLSGEQAQAIIDAEDAYGKILEMSKTDNRETSENNNQNNNKSHIVKGFNLHNV